MTGASTKGLGVMLAAALQYAERGIPVFPCAAAGRQAKRPLTPKESKKGAKDGGLYLATTDARQIDAWWRRWPDAMIGMPCGERSGIAVVDLDPHEADADAMLRGVADFCGGSLPPCPVTRTQSGGYHLWFRHRDGLGNRANLFKKAQETTDVAPAIRSHVDVRADGGYVIVPPSVMANGNVYSFVERPDWEGLPELPQRLFEVIARTGEFSRSWEAAAGKHPPAGTRAGSSAPPVGGATADDAKRKYALAGMEMDLSELRAARPGSRGETLNRVGFQIGTLVGAGALSRAVAEAGLREACDMNGLTVTDGSSLVMSNIQRSIEAGMASPRDLSGIGTQTRRFAGRPPPHGQPRPSRSGSAPRPPGDGMDESGALASPQGLSSEEGDPGWGGGDDEPPDEIDWNMLRRCAEFPETDIGNGKRFLERHRADVVSIARIGMHIYDGRRWKEDVEGSTVRPLAHQVVEQIGLEPIVIEPTVAELHLLEEREAALEQLAELEKKDELSREDKTEQARLKQVVRNGDVAIGLIKDRKAKRRRFAKTSGGSQRVDSMVKEAACYITREIGQFDTDPLALNCQNGTLRFAETDGVWDRNCADHDRDDLITKLVPVDYDPKAECPQFLNFLEEILPDAMPSGEIGPGEAVRDFLQRYLGYCLTARTTEQVFVFCYGEGRNGKSTLVDLVCRILGDYATTVPFETLAGDDKRKGSEATPDLARLPGARLVRASEPEQKMSFREATVKSLTGGEPVLVRRLHQDFVEIYPTFKLIVSGNHKPKIQGTDDGIWRRVLLVPFEVQIEKDKVDKTLPDKLWAERSGILNWLIAGLLSYLQDGLRVPDSVRAATDEYREESDPVGAFCRDALIVTANEDLDSATPGDLYAAFKVYCARNGHYPIGVNTFNRQMPKKADKFGFRKSKSSGTVYRGVVIKQEFQPRADGKDDDGED